MESVFDKLRDYYSSIAASMKSEAERARAFSNNSDKGQIREDIYLKFLKDHLPSSCNVAFGGFLFNFSESESKQLDILIHNQHCPIYDLNGKRFGPVDGCIGVVSIKSTLTKKELIDSLEGFNSIPNLSVENIRNTTIIGLSSSEKEDFPFKILYAHSGLSLDVILQHIRLFYEENYNIPYNKKPNVIHVNGEYCLKKVSRVDSMSEIIKGSFTDKNGRITFPYVVFCANHSDAIAMSMAIDGLQKASVITSNMYLDYSNIVKGIAGL